MIIYVNKHYPHIDRTITGKSELNIMHRKEFEPMRTLFTVPKATRTHTHTRTLTYITLY